jgi:hypothetical protein
VKISNTWSAAPPFILTTFIIITMYTTNPHKKKNLTSSRKWIFFLQDKCVPLALPREFIQWQAGNHKL